MELSYGKLLLLLLIVVLLFGSRKIPTIGRDLGTAVRNFKKSAGDSEDKNEKLEKEKENDTK